MKHEDLSSLIIGLCIKVHRELGPGLLESVYEEALCYELTKNNILHRRQQGIRATYDNHDLGIGFRADVIVEDKILIELKSLDILPAVYFKVLLTYLRFSKIEIGLIVNFKTVVLKDGITRIVLDRRV